MTKVRKVCQRCGAVADVKPRVVRCRVRRFGPSSYCCWGRLVRQAPVTRPMPKTLTPQEIAVRRFVYARKKVAEKTKQLVVLTRAIQRWERRATRYAEVAALTEGELMRLRLKRSEAAKKRKTSRRGIDLGAT